LYIYTLLIKLYIVLCQLKIIKFLEAPARPRISCLSNYVFWIGSLLAFTIGHLSIKRKHLSVNEPNLPMVITYTRSTKRTIGVVSFRSMDERNNFSASVAGFNRFNSQMK